MCRPKPKAQSSLEMAVALVSVCILLCGAMNVFIWLNKRMARRQQDYEKTRVAAGNSTSAKEIQVNETQYPKLNIFEGVK